MYFTSYFHNVCKKNLDTSQIYSNDFIFCIFFYNLFFMYSHSHNVCSLKNNPEQKKKNICIPKHFFHLISYAKLVEHNIISHTHLNLFGLKIIYTMAPLKVLKPLNSFFFKNNKTPTPRFYHQNL